MSRGRANSSDLSALADLAPELAQMLVAVACDVAVVLDDGGVVQTVAVSGSPAVSHDACNWIGQRWTETFTGDARSKAAELLDDLATSGTSRLRHLSHASHEGDEIPIAYTAVRLGEEGPTLAVGRDLRVVSAMQERLLQAQHAIEREHWQRRQAETRYRLLFQFASEPALILDPVTFQVIDANRAAAVLCGCQSEQLAGQPVTDLVEAGARAPLCETLARARSSERPIESTTRLAATGEAIDVTATAFDIGSSGVLVLRAHPKRPAAATPAHSADVTFAGLVKRTPDAVVITDGAGTITLANAAFRELVSIDEHATPIGRPLSDWLGSALEVILGRLRESGVVRLASARISRGEAPRIDVELSATRIVGGEAIGFIMRVAHARYPQAVDADGDTERHVH